MFNKVRSISLMMLLCLVASTGIANAEKKINYKLDENWARQEVALRSEKPVDLFYVTSTTDIKGLEGYNLDYTDKVKNKIYNLSLNKESSPYRESCAIFAPYYRQVTFPAYFLPKEDGKQYFDLAYKDVQKAFAYYLKKRPAKRPFIVAGFSQGADMAQRLLLDEKFNKRKDIRKNLVAAYTIGWGITEEQIKESGSKIFKPAQKADDVGVTIVFNTEAPAITESLLVPKEMRSVCINPFNWRTDSTYAFPEENLGGKLINPYGKVDKELGQITGGYIDVSRGTVKVPDIDPQVFKGIIFPDGIYHIYDYQFTFSNLEKNIADRIAAFNKKAK